jgi:hypothetical protein
MKLKLTSEQTHQIFEKGLLELHPIKMTIVSVKKLKEYMLKVK